MRPDFLGSAQMIKPFSPAAASSVLGFVLEKNQRKEMNGKCQEFSLVKDLENLQRLKMTTGLTYYHLYTFP